MTFQPRKASMREVKRAGQEEIRQRLRVLDQLTAVLQRMGGRIELPAAWYDAIDRNEVDVTFDDRRGMVVFQVRGWEDHKLTMSQRIVRWLLHL